MYNPEMRKKVMFFLPGIILLAISLGMLFWGYSPTAVEQRVIQIPSIGEQIIRWTPRIKMGDTGQIDLEFFLMETLAEDAAGTNEGNNSQKSFRWNSIKGYEYLQVETRLELAQALIEPGGELIQSLRPGESLKQSWQVKPLDGIAMDAEIWIYLRLPSVVQPESIREAISIQTVELSPQFPYFISGQVARISGIIGIGLAMLYLLFIARSARKFILS